MGQVTGHIDPYGATQAFAKGARAHGAVIREHCAVRALQQTPEGGWIVSTDAGDIHAEWIVNAAGLWADEVAAMTGARLPMTRMEHHYLITEEIPEIAARDTELPLIRDGDSSFYMRQERKGLLLGVYEDAATPWALDGVPPDFGRELLPDAIDRLMPNLEQAFTRFPVLAGTGIAKTVNGPFVLLPDGNPLIGPMPGQSNHFAAAAFLAGLNMGGGFGELIAEWIDTKRTVLDLASCDVGRFGDWAPGAYATARARDTYAHRYQLHYPFEERDAGRPVRAFPLHDTHCALGAVMGPVNGWERPLWYAPAGDVQRDMYGFIRQNWFDAVAEECKAVRGGVGLMDASAFAKYVVSGPHAEAWLDGMVANTLPTRSGRARLVHMCDHAGGIVAEFTALRRKDGSFLLVGASAAETIHLRWMQAHATKGVEVAAVTERYGVIALQGPKAPDVLARLTEADLDGAAFPYLSGQTIRIAGIHCLALRVSFVGEQGWELYVSPDDLVALWTALVEAGRAEGIRPFGGRALDWLRLEVGYARYGSEINTEVAPFDVGLGWAVVLDKGEFIGREALARMRPGLADRPRLRLLFAPGKELAADALGPIGLETVLDAEGTPCGYITSAGYSPTTGDFTVMALLKPVQTEDRDLHVDLLGHRVGLHRLDRPPHASRSRTRTIASADD